jgi:hypothetical protein
MTRKSSFITAVGAALVLALPATAAAHDRDFVQAPQWKQALMVRSLGLNERYELGVYAPKVQGPSFHITGVSQAEQALRIRSEALNEQYGLGDQAGSSVPMLDAREHAFTTKRVDQPTVSGRDVVSTLEKPAVTDGGTVDVTGGTEIQWSQIGAGLGIGALLVLGLWLALKATRQRPLAH